MPRHDFGFEVTIEIGIGIGFGIGFEALNHSIFTWLIYGEFTSSINLRYSQYVRVRLGVDFRSNSLDRRPYRTQLTGLPPSLLPSIPTHTHRHQE